jgi:hypothetical protein
MIFLSKKNFQFGLLPIDGKDYVDIMFSHCQNLTHQFIEILIHD